jgi:hypothetical protein
VGASSKPGTDVAVAVSEALFAIIIINERLDYTVAQSRGYQVIRGLIVGTFVFVYSNVGRALWSRLYGRIVVDEAHPVPLWFRCWQDAALLLSSLAMLGLAIGLGFLCSNYYYAQTGTYGSIPTNISAQVASNMAFGLFFSFTVQTGFMFFLGYVPRSWLLWLRDLSLGMVTCTACRRARTPTAARTATPAACTDAEAGVVAVAEGAAEAVPLHLLDPAPVLGTTRVDEPPLPAPAMAGSALPPAPDRQPGRDGSSRAVPGQPHSASVHVLVSVVSSTGEGDVALAPAPASADPPP